MLLQQILYYMFRLLMLILVLVNSRSDQNLLDILVRLLGLLVMIMIHLLVVIGESTSDLTRRLS